MFIQRYSSHIINALSECFPKGDVKGGFIKEQVLPIEELTQIIERRSGALRALQDRVC